MYFFYYQPFSRVAVLCHILSLASLPTIYCNAIQQLASNFQCGIHSSICILSRALGDVPLLDIDAMHRFGGEADDTMGVGGH